MKKLLHVGCGTYTKKDTIPYFFNDDWEEIRFDINPDINPDIIGSLTDMSAVKSETVDAVYSAHNIEHLFEHEVSVPLSEFYRVLKKDGFLVLTCPELKSLCKFVAINGLNAVAYPSSSGSIMPHDIFYGWGPALKAGNLFMAHKCGFDVDTMREKLHIAGFSDASVFVSEPNFALWALASKSLASQEESKKFARLVFDGLPYFDV